MDVLYLSYGSIRDLAAAGLQSGLSRLYWPTGFVRVSAVLPDREHIAVSCSALQGFHQCLQFWPMRLFTGPLLTYSIFTVDCLADFHQRKKTIYTGFLQKAEPPKKSNLYPPQLVRKRKSSLTGKTQPQLTFSLIPE